MPLKPTTDQDKQSALESEYTPLYAVAGLTDALAETLKAALTELSSKRPALEKQAKEGAGELREFVITLPEQFKQLPEATKVRIAELQKQANELMAQATSTYGELAGRGKHAVDEAIGSARKLSSKAEKPADATDADSATTVDPALANVQEGVTTTPSMATGPTTTESVPPPSAESASATDENAN